MMLVLVILGVLNTIGVRLYLFWTVLWFDMIMHFLGGLFIALLFFSILSLLSSRLGYVERLVLGLMVVLLVGIAWEYYELVSGVTNLADRGYWSDTGMDIVMDTLGALVGIVGAHNIEKKNV